MKTFKKLGLGLSVILFFSLATLAVLPTHKASAAVCQSGAVCTFIAEPFNSTFALQNGQITTTIGKGTNVEQQLVFTFTGATSTTETYTSTENIFCTLTQTHPAAPATITMGLPPYGNTINATLHAYWLSSAGGGCSSSDSNKGISITNNDTSTGGGGGGGGGSQGLPTTIMYNGQSYTLIQQGIPLYGLKNSLSPDCFGGSVIVTNTAGTTGTAYLGLQYDTNGGLTYLAPILNQAGQLTTALNNEINGCGFPGSASTQGYSGSITNGTLNAPTPGGGGGGTTTAPSCYSGGLLTKIFSLEWLLCPMLNMVDYAVSEFDGIIQGLLTFDTSKYLCGGLADTTSQAQATNCEKQSNGTYHAWSITRDIASGFLVIIMLIAVISQAVSRE